VPRKRKDLQPGESLHLSVRLESEIAQQIDGVIAELSRATGLSVSRTDVVRLLLREALEARSSTKRRK
jgi:metal-responsive CopG/Arc/MetJ family transcriptional regulator